MTGIRHAQVTGVGSSLPPRVVPNVHFESMVDTTDDWIRDRTGIESRRFAGEGETTSTLAAEAASRALDVAGVGAESVDLLIVATCTPDQPVPATAAFVQTHLGMSCPGFDLNAACAGFVYGLSMAAGQVRSGAADRVLVVGAEVMSRVLNMADRTTCVLFGDGAGAVLVEPGDEPGLIDSRLALDGSMADLLSIPGGGSAEPASRESVERARITVHMTDGATVFRQAVVAMATSCEELLTKNGLTAGDLDVVVAHQANSRIIASVGRRLGVDPEKVVVDIAEVGNTSGASIPIALDRAWRARRLSPGDLVLTTAFGAGLAWGSSLLRWTVPSPEDRASPQAPTG